MRKNIGVKPKRKLKIGIIAPIEESIPPERYGGTELIVYHLVEGLIKKGHQVTLFASGDSKTSARLISPFPKCLRKAGEEINHEVARLFSLFQAIQHQEEFDIIHNHAGWRFLPFAHSLKTKTVHTYHTYFFERTRFFFKQFKDQPFTFLSKNQRSFVPFLKNAVIVYNGIDVKQFEFNANPQNYFAFLGRFSPLKGALEAIQIALKAKIKLLIGAKIETENKKEFYYFNNKIKPLLKHPKIKYLGELNHKEKVELLKNARALLFPIQWEEPFGLVLIEAMACGTPVIALNRGAVPEIVINKKTGFVVKTLKGMIGALKKIDKINRFDCRKLVEQKFTVERMVNNYEKVYFRLLNLPH